MFGLLALAVEFVLGLLVEAGTAIEDALQRKGMSWAVSVVTIIVILTCFGLCCLGIWALWVFVNFGINQGSAAL